jgi:hypothetical protein
MWGHVDFDRLVKFVRDDGCPVRLYNKRKMKIAECMGTFDISKRGNPIISLAIQDSSPLERRRVLLHEYGHYKQWQSGFLSACEREIKGWDVLDKWLCGMEFSEQDLVLARNCICLIEYDAEIRTVQLSRSLGVDIGREEDYLDSAHSYISHLKHVFMTRNWCNYEQLGLCHKKLSPGAALRDLTEEEIKTLEQ